MDSAGPASEPVPGLAECALAERKDLVRSYREDQGFPGEVMEAAVACLVLPSPVPLVCPRLSQALQHRVVGDLNGVALDHDVQPVLPVVAAGYEDHVRVAAQVDRLLLARAGGEVNGAVEPDGNQRRDVRPSVCADRANPEELGRLDHLAGLVPSDHERARFAEPRVNICHWPVHVVSPSGQRCAAARAATSPCPCRARRTPAIARQPSGRSQARRTWARSALMSRRLPVTIAAHAGASARVSRANPASMSDEIVLNCSRSYPVPRDAMARAARGRY